MLRRGILLFLAFTLSLVSATATHDVRNALELTIHQSVASSETQGTCTHVALRASGTHNGLRNKTILHEKRLLDSHGRYTKSSKNAVIERRTTYATQENVSLLWDTVESACGTDWLDTEGMTLLLPPGHMAPGSEWTGQNQEVLAARSSESLVPPLRVTPLVQSGPSDNRVDLVFFADGYTAAEESKFIADATRLAEDVSRNQTFDTVRPLLNFWAAFTPSAESGIGVGGVPKDTAFGLYRDGTELRGVYYDKPAVARAACHSLGDACDYPILVGNDNLYGGLGGEFTVITPSPFNGPLVLRHELGHSIIDVGEEYDGGEYDGYFGVNAAPEPEAVTWSHWLTDAEEVKRVERSAMPFQEYAWSMLNTSSAWRAAFESNGSYARHVVRFSLSGLPKKEDLIVRLDGRDLGWTPRGGIGEDRWHYDVFVDERLKEGTHRVEFELKSKEQEGVAQLCSVEVLEFGSEKQFNATEGFVGAFATYADDYRRSLRPTNEGCLMRIVTTPEFCSVCKEGLWLSLLQRVSLVDKIDTSCERDGTRTLSLTPLPLGRFRDENEKKELARKNKEERLRIRWLRDGVEQKALEDEVQVNIGAAESIAHWVAEVILEHNEVRKDEERLMGSTVEWVIDEPCEEE